MSFVTDMFGGGDAPTVAPYQASPITTTTGTATPSGSGGVTTTLSPELQNIYDLYLKSVTTNLPTAEGTDFANKVSQYGQSMFGNAANLDTKQMTSDYYNQVLAGLDPQRQQEDVTLANTLFSQGRTGAGTGVAGGGYVNPEQFALLKAREQANAGIYLTAEDRARAIKQDTLSKALGYYGLGNELKSNAWNLPTSLLGTGISLAGVNNPLVGYSLQAGQNVTGVNTQNAQIEAQNQAQNLGFWGNLIGGGLSAWGKKA